MNLPVHSLYCSQSVIALLCCGCLLTGQRRKILRLYLGVNRPDDLQILCSSVTRRVAVRLYRHLGNIPGHPYP